MAFAHTEPVDCVTYVADTPVQIAAARANFRRQVFSRRTMIRASVLISVLVAIGLAIGLLDGGSNAFGWAIMLGGEGIILIPCLYLALYLFLPRRIRRLTAQSTLYDDPVRICWSTAGLSSEHRSGTTAMAWHEYHAVRHARSGFLFYFNDQQYQIVPTAALSPAQLDSLTRALAASGLRHV